MTERESVRDDPVTIWVNFGPLSGRVVVVAVADRRELGSAAHQYSHAVISGWLPSGELLPQPWALQAPSDWRAVLARAVPDALAASGVDPSQLIGIATDLTACTMLRVTWDVTPSASWRWRDPSKWDGHADCGAARRRPPNPCGLLPIHATSHDPTNE